jgi:MFS family permease
MSRPMTDRKRWIALDVTVVNVALPPIRDDLGFSRSSLVRVVNAYLIAFGGLLLLAGRLGDLISRRGMKMPLEDENVVIYGAGEGPRKRRP